MEAFTDGVVAIIITIMVLGAESAQAGPDFAALGGEPARGSSPMC